MGLNFKILQISPLDIYMTLYAESTTDQTDHFADAFVRENIAHCYDFVMTFESLPLTQFCLEKFSVRKGIFFMFLRRFQCKFGWNKVT